MSWLFGGNASQTQFDEAVDNATSELLPSGSDETLLTSLQLSDQIRSKTVDASYALRSMRRRIAHKNPNVQIQALHVLDVLVKNSGEAFLLAVGNGKDGWMTELEDLCKSSNHDLRQIATKYLQNWALAFQSTSTSSALSSSDLVHLYNRLRNSISFPPADHAMTSSMISSLSAPEWVDSDLCQRCRTPFTLTNRKHHCRNCGGIFCGDCSSKTMKLEHLGIDQEVRVCDGCYKKLKTPGGRSASISQQRSLQSGQPHVNGAKKSQEEIDFERAIALSLAESSSSAPSDPYAQSKSLPGVGYGYEAKPSKPPSSNQAAQPSKQLEEEDPDLAAAIRASLAEVQPQASTSTLSSASAPPKSSYVYAPAVQPSVPSYELAMSEFDALDSFSNALRDPNIRQEDANELFTRADRHRGKMYRALEDAHAKSSMLNELNQKLQHAVRLYDSLLERNISRYAQPYQQQAPPQQYYQTPSAPSQYYQPGPAYQPQQPFHAQPNQSQPYPVQAMRSYAEPRAQNAQQPYHGPPVAEHASPPPLQHTHSYQSQTQNYGASPTRQYSTVPEHTDNQYQQHAQHPVQTPATPQQQYGSPAYQHQSLAAMTGQQDEQYYNAYPADAAQHNGYPVDATYGQAQEQQQSFAGPREDGTYAGQAPDTEHTQQAPYNDISELSSEQQSAQPEANGHRADPHAASAAPQYANHPNEVNGRFQGFYSSSSFPAVPSMPVGGLPAAPKGEFAHHEETKAKEEVRKEEALIEF